MTILTKQPRPVNIFHDRPREIIISLPTLPFLKDKLILFLFGFAGVQTRAGKIIHCSVYIIIRTYTYIKNV